MSKVEPNRKKTGGRKKGTPNKATADVQELARRYGPEAVDLLWEIARNAKSSEASRVGALKEILDRAYGKSRQPVGGEEAGQPIEHKHDVTVRYV